MPDINNDVVAANFSRASCSYDLVAKIQKECCYKLVAMIRERLPHFIPASVLDIGAGTGYLTKLLLSEFPDASFTMNDISYAMLSRAKEIVGKNVSTILGDMSKVKFPVSDLIVSSMAIHWSSNPVTVLKRVCRSSKVFAFSILVQPSLYEWNRLFHELSLPSPGLHYISSEEVELAMLDTSPTLFTWEVCNFDMRFASPREFIRYMRQLGSNYSPDGFNAYHVRKVLKHAPGEFFSKYSVMFGVVSWPYS
ncbi:malonyl-ACP O-methyltransferase BioC [Neorickettsia sennetsu]|uniref:Malonyl-[acyl-carrier protein] O-methyltransferase n=1 Tax=Ehrlichia sennetsu (strain ATCC VR-367 / Miyayama) TaxID=222891 RepID=Q2GDF1_EHRS3|nr:malonyl-ACP O-methyltransferase BioC [Neorickettsia sennetsu]ABD45939.1 biotin biosynthesis protein BioC [Neorickettsia sennetsu str. Miyayama]